jgi:hypothetical protein
LHRATPSTVAAAAAGIALTAGGLVLTGAGHGLSRVVGVLVLAGGIASVWRAATAWFGLDAPERDTSSGPDDERR